MVALKGPAGDIEQCLQVETDFTIINYLKTEKISIIYI